MFVEVIKHFARYPHVFNFGTGIKTQFKVLFRLLILIILLHDAWDIVTTLTSKRHQVLIRTVFGFCRNSFDNFD